MTLLVDLDAVVASALPASEVRRKVAQTLRRVAMCEPGAALRTARALDQVLRLTDTSTWPELGASFSTLTNVGAPVEFAWSSRDAALRWTAEVGPPETDDRARLQIAAGLAFDPLVPDVALAVLARLQGHVRLRYGAWLGMRHRETHDEGKVYAEIPEQPLACAAAAFGLRHPVVRTAGLTARMAGVFADGSVELYARGFDVDEAIVRGLEASVLRSDERLWPVVHGLVGGARMPRPCGVSIVFEPFGQPIALTWFTFAKAVHFDDAQTIAALDHGTLDAASRTLLAALASGRDDGRRRCGMVGVGVAGVDEPWLQAGLRPT